MHVPERILTTERIENLSLRDQCWFRHTFWLRPETAAAQMNAALEKLRAVLAAETSVEPHSRVRLRRVTDAALEVEVHACVRARNEEAFREVQEHLLLLLLKDLEDAGADLAMPSQRTYGVGDRVLPSAGVSEEPGRTP